jgi:predicted Zn finger-like uncharacterized protein
MPIATACPHCKQRLSVADQHSGKQVRCAKCRQVFLVPAAAVAPPRVASQANPLAVPAKPSLPSSQLRPDMKHPRRGSNRRVWVLCLGCAGLLLLVLGGGLVGVGLWLYQPKPPPSSGGAAELVMLKQAAQGNDARSPDGRKAGDSKGEKAPATPNGLPLANKGQVVHAQLKDGLFQTQAKLGAGDFDDPVRQALCKLYDIDLQAGRKYSVEVVSKDFGAYLIVEDAASFEIAEDFDRGGKHKALVACTPSKTGRHRIIVTTVGRATGDFTLTIRADKSGGPAVAPGAIPKSARRFDWGKLVGQ